VFLDRNGKVWYGKIQVIRMEAGDPWAASLRNLTSKHATPAICTTLVTGKSDGHPLRRRASGTPARIRERMSGR
jgi:hypothetical protein